MKVKEIHNPHEPGNPIVINFSSKSGEFTATVNGEKKRSNTLSEIVSIINTELEYEPDWKPIIRVEISGKKYEWHQGLDVNISRYYLSKFHGDETISANWHIMEDFTAGRMQGWKRVPYSHSYYGEYWPGYRKDGVFVFEYNEALWNALCLIQNRIAKAREDLIELLSQPVLPEKIEIPALSQEQEKLEEL